MAVAVLLLLVQSWLWLRVLRWVFRNIKLGCGTHLDFTGSFLQLFGWTLFLYVSILTIVGWAGVVRGMTRWLLSNVQAGDRKLVFLGTSLEILWRGLAFAVVAVLSLGIAVPWLFTDLCRWAAGKLYVERLPEAA